MAEERILESRHKIMSNIKEDIKFKPTLDTPESKQAKAFEKNFKSTMSREHVKLNETDELLTEKEQSLKKKIFTLPKMEALVHSDPKLSTVYNEMSENGEEKYGYHYNETIMNMLFNDYVLNSPKYLQKYKMAIPIEKKRRDASGINQAKKVGAEIMKKTHPEFKPEVNPEVKPPETLKENGEGITKVQFLVNEKDPKNPDVFAYFPDENYDEKGTYKTGYSHIGQHSAVHPQYAAESRPATPEEYADLKAELESVGYNLAIVNSTNNAIGESGEMLAQYVQNAFTNRQGSTPINFIINYLKNKYGMSDKEIETLANNSDDIDMFFRANPNPDKLKVYADKKYQEIKNPANETTGSGSSGAYVGPAAWKKGGDLIEEPKKVEETTTAGSAGGAAGYVGYAGPAAWGGGDLMKGGKSKIMRKPIWPGGTIIAESSYLTDPSGFEKYAEMLNEADISYQRELGKEYQQSHSGSNNGLGVSEVPQTPEREKLKKGIDDNTALFVGQDVDKMRDDDVKILHNDMTQKNTMFPHPENPNLQDDGISGSIDKNLPDEVFSADAEQSKTKPFTPTTNVERDKVNDFIIDKTSAFTSDAVKDWNDPDRELELDTIKTGEVDKPNLNVVEGISPDMYSTKEDLKQLAQTVKQRTGKGITKDHIPMLADEALYTIAIQLANKYLSSKGIPVGWDELGDTNSMWDYIDRNGNMSFDRLWAAVKEATDERLGNEGFEGFPVDEGCGKGKKAKSQNQQQFAGMVHGLQKGEIKPSEVSSDVKDAAKSMTKKFAKDLASTKHKGLPEKIDEQNPALEENMFSPALQGFSPIGFIINYLKQKYPKTISFEDEKEILDSSEDYVGTALRNASPRKLISYAEAIYKGKLNKDKFNEETQTMIQSNGTSMSNKATATGDQSSNVDVGTRSTGGISESDQRLLEELNNELEAYSIHHNKLKVMAEDRKPSALVLRDRVGSENEKNFKSDLQDSGTKEIIDVEKELQWKDQQTDVGKDPQKLGADIEKTEIKATDAKSGEALKNVGDSANDEGDEIPKRNFTDDEQHEVDMHRLGQQDLVYDNEPGKRFEDRMKADMGDKLYKQRQEKLKFRGKAPMYNKDPQPVEDTTANKVQFDKEQTGWNERVGLKEGIVTGKYFDNLGKKRIIDFNLNEVWELKTGETIPLLQELSLEGLGNTYTQKVSANENVVKAMTGNKFFTNGTEVFVFKTPVQNITESEHKEEKPVINEQFNKMKHLLGYKPNDFVDTKNVKKNRGF